MSAIESKCDQCGSFAGFEEAPSGQVCSRCDDWICDDCTWHDDGCTPFCENCYHINEDKE